MSVPNMEEAASVAAEYVASLDNLPSEIQFLLAEIRHKETRSQELLQEIQKDTTRYIKHTLRGGGGASTPGANGKDVAALPAKIAADHAAADALAAEKLALAARVQALLARARARLDHDLARVLVLQGELAPGAPPPFAGLGAGARGPAATITESLRQALAGVPDLPLARHASPAAAPAPAQKKRKLAAGGSVKLASPAPSGAHTPVTGARGRVSAAASSARQSPAAPRGRRAAAAAAAAAAASAEELSEDGALEDEGEALAEEGEDAEDNSPYCFCQRPSFGEMVGCDNLSCPYQWFHLECVHLSTPLPDVWYCSECTAKGFAVPARKGRKK